jgi:hypothetical protein
MSGRRSRSRVFAASLVLLSSSACLCLAVPNQATGASLSQLADPSYQTNGRVTSIITAGNTVYLGGDFTSVRPPGAPAGTQEVARAHLAAFRLDTGKLRSWDPGTDGPVSALSASPSGRTIFVGGDFTHLSGTTRHHLGAVSADSGAIKHFRANTNGPVLAITVTSSTVYLGGSFATVKGASRERLAATNRRGRLLHRWKPRASDTVRSLAMSTGGRKVYVGGDFTTINSRPNQHLAAVSATFGRIEPWKSHPGYGVWDIIVRPHRLYLGGNGIGGRIAAFTPRGRHVWATQTDGGVQALAYLRGRIIAGGHFRNVCVGNNPGPPSGFKCPAILANRLRLLAVGHRSGALKNWNPGVNSGLGVFALTATNGAFYAGGDFTRVNVSQLDTADQQGFARFTGS